MVRYSLTCAEGHAFESWFASAKAFDDLAARGLLSCAECGSPRVGKALMAPSVRTERADAARADGRPALPREAPAEAPAGPSRPLAQPRDGREGTRREEMLARWRRHVEETSTYVGPGFAAEARAMHEGTAPERSIYGEARADEARALIEDGIPVAPLPFTPKRSAN